LVAATAEEARRVMVEGPSGLLAVAGPGERPRFEPSLKRLVFPDGSEATLYSGAHPEALRGPEHHFAWCDELAKWRHPKTTWDMLQLGLRMGEAPRALVTTTPRAGSAALKAVLAGAARTGGATGANPHLPDAYLEAVLAAYGGTRLGRQEIEGLLAEDLEGSLWPAALIEASRGAAPAADALVRVVIGVDPPASAGGTCGIVACGLDADGGACAGRSLGGRALARGLGGAGGGGGGGAWGRPGGGGEEPGRRHGGERAAQRGAGAAGDVGERVAGESGAGRAGGGDVRVRTGAAGGAVSRTRGGAGDADRGRRGGRLAGPGGRDGLGDLGAGDRAAGGAEG
jgi:hypothetical protein